ncbi:FUSC family protein [Chachezhania sediminis]|uniref:FUSC family protein n=1 Tax=Chachezhania sediminis TaxID=2599291 RepID=UPI00131DF700|nr:FUSC family protein [Chachezhania sediminis]
MTTPHPGRITAARQLIHPGHVRDSLHIRRQTAIGNSVLTAVQTALTMAIALPLVMLSPWPDLVGYAALGALAALFGRFAPTGARMKVLIAAALCQVMAVLTMSTLAWAGMPAMGLLLAVALCCGIFFYIAMTGRFGGPGALVFVFAAGASMSAVPTFDMVLSRTAATAAVAVLAVALCAATEIFRITPSAERPLPVEPVLPAPDRVTVALRITVGAAIAGLVSHAMGAAHPVWACMGAMAVLQGTHLHISMNRALQRLTGTVLGALLAWALLALDPSPWEIIGLLVLLQFGTELVIGSNYGLGLILVTPMALLMSRLAAGPAAGTAMVPERIVDTLVGAGIAIVIAVLLSSLDDRHTLARHHAGLSRG